MDVMVEMDVMAEMVYVYQAPEKLEYQDPKDPKDPRDLRGHEDRQGQLVGVLPMSGGGEPIVLM